MGRSWAVLGHLGAVWERLGELKTLIFLWFFNDFWKIDVLSKRGHFGRSWAFLGLTWADLGSSWGDLGRSWGILGRSWGDLGVVLGHLGAVLGRLGAVLAALGPLLGRSWPLLGPPLAVRSLPGSKSGPNPSGSGIWTGVGPAEAP